MPKVADRRGRRDTRAHSPPVVRPLHFEEISELADALSDSTSRAQLENRWREQEIGYREILVAELDGRIVGTVSINQPMDRPFALHLFALDVGAGWRNRGVGGALVERAIEEARRRGLRSVYLEVRVDNPARRLYQRLGFRRVGMPFLNGWWRYAGDGERERVEELSVRMVRRVRPGPSGVSSRSSSIRRPAASQVVE